MKRIKILLIVFLGLLLVGCGEANVEKEEEQIANPVNEVKADYNLGETFRFMSFDVTVNNYESIETIDKSMSSDNGKKVIKVPVEVKNTGDSNDHLSMFYYKLYDASNKEVNSKGSYYDDSLDYAKDLKPGEKYTKYLYIPYDGPGKYVIEFNNFSSKLKLVIEVK